MQHACNMIGICLRNLSLVTIRPCSTGRPLPILPIEPDELSLDALGARQQVIDRLFAIMLWPHDEKSRDLAFRVADAQHYTEQLEFIARNSDQSFDVELTDLTPLARALVDLPAAHTISKPARAAYRHGLAAGLIFSFVIDADDSQPGSASLQEAKNYVMEMRGFLPAQSVSTINNTVWGRYQPVAHLWAAYLTRAIVTEESASNLWGWQFPCWNLEIEDFLALAERLRKRGEGLRPVRASNDLMPPEKAWSVGHDIALPDTDLRWVTAAA